MPQEIAYLVERRVVYQRFYDLVTIDEMHHANDTVVQLIRQGEPPVHTLIDAAEVTRLNFPLQQLLHVTDFFDEPGLGWILLLNDSPVARFFASMIGHGKNFRQVTSRDEAYSLLQQADPRLAMSQMQFTQHP